MDKSLRCKSGIVDCERAGRMTSRTMKEMGREWILASREADKVYTFRGDYHEPLTIPETWFLCRRWRNDGLMFYSVHDASLTRQDEEQTNPKLRIVHGSDGSRLAC